jgi:hypothetical protein
MLDAVSHAAGRWCGSSDQAGDYGLENFRLVFRRLVPMNMDSPDQVEGRLWSSQE